MAARTKTLFTIGYEKATPEALIETLRAAGVTTVLDVRQVAFSRKPAFSKRALSEWLAAAGIGYAHIRALGTPKEGREAARRGDVETMREIFAAHMSGTEAQAALGEAVEMARAAPCCLLCLERDHNDCHRAIVSDIMAKRGGFRIEKLVA